MTTEKTIRSISLNALMAALLTTQKEFKRKNKYKNIDITFTDFCALAPIDDEALINTILKDCKEEEDATRITLNPWIQKTGIVETIFQDLLSEVEDVTKATKVCKSTATRYTDTFYGVRIVIAKEVKCEGCVKFKPFIFNILFELKED